MVKVVDKEHYLFSCFVLSAKVRQKREMFQDPLAILQHN